MHTINLNDETFQKLKALAKRERRTIRAQLDMIILKALEELESLH